MAAGAGDASAPTVRKKFPVRQPRSVRIDGKSKTNRRTGSKRGAGAIETTRVRLQGGSAPVGFSRLAAVAARDSATISP
jgi:hypothetical protein